MDDKIYCIKGTYTLRQIAGEYLAIPLGNEPGNESRIVTLNAVSLVIWSKLEAGASFDEILNTVLAEFNVEKEEAAADIKEFLDGLEKAGLLK